MDSNREVVRRETLWVAAWTIGLALVAHIVFIAIGQWDPDVLWGSLIGCAVLFTVNILFIPKYSYMACAWGGVAGYGTAMVLSYVVGQVKNPIPYPMKSITVYFLLTALFYWLMTLVPTSWPIVLRLAINTLLILLFCGHVWWHEMRK